MEISRKTDRIGKYEVLFEILGKFREKFENSWKIFKELENLKKNIFELFGKLKEKV